ncbi:MAG TPA: helix-turn-helix domain-containing protein [Gaiellaceae bacterium]|nr:helix-turn-helix domain-containing protein [Gaiellaceae bacterium]
MTAAEVGDYLGVTERQVLRMKAEGDLTPTYVRSLLRFHIEDVEHYIAANRRPAEA